MVKNPSPNARDMGFILDWGTKMPHAARNLKPVRLHATQRTCMLQQRPRADKIIIKRKTIGWPSASADFISNLYPIGC